MAMHNQHPDMPDDAVLADDCERCRQHAEDPFAALDDGNLTRLYQLSMYGDKKHVITTINDRIAIKEIENVFLKHNRIARALVATGTVMGTTA